MTTSHSMPQDSGPVPTDQHSPATARGRRKGVSRTGSLWTAVTIALLLLVLLVVFILQNAGRVSVHYFKFAGSLPLGVALLIAAVGGGLVVAIVGVGRISQLRMRMRRNSRRNDAESLDNK